MLKEVTNIHPTEIPCLVYANSEGEIIELPDLKMAGRSGDKIVVPKLTEIIPLPDGSELFTLPERHPIGIDILDGQPTKLAEDPCQNGKTVSAVAAFMAPAHTAIYSTAYEKISPTSAPLPLFAYAAVGWHDGRFWVAAFRSDDDPRQDAGQFHPSHIKKKTITALSKHSENRLIQHLGKCCLTYSCPAAKNYFLNRWEAPIPTSPSCNADCVGCISLQASGCCPSTQERIQFIPSPHEIAEMAVAHLQSAPKPIVSFGQGCEGEPLLQAKTIEKAIIKIRQLTDKGTINLNSNSGLPDKVKKLAKAGLDSIRVSMNSAREKSHTLYYRPKGFSFGDVRKSILTMKEAGKFVSLNYFILPGFTDDPAEAEAFFKLVETYQPDLIQLRNLNMDPDWYFDTVQHQPAGEPWGIVAWFEKLKKQFPMLHFGYYNPYLAKPNNK